MKKLFLAIVLLGALPSGAQTTGPIIGWEKSVFDFGDIVQGEQVEHTFKFKNTGTEALVITNVQVTCGCTTPKGWARDPIAPGQTSEVTVAFNSMGKFGKQTKVVTVVSNAVNQDGGQITFLANVVDKKNPN